MLCSLWHGADGWFFLPVGDKALLPGREVTVRYGGGGAFELRYPISDAESEVFLRHPHRPRRQRKPYFALLPPQRLRL